MIFLPEGLKTFNISEDQLTHLVPLHHLYIYLYMNIFIYEYIYK